MSLTRPHICFVAPTAWPVVSGDASVGSVGGAEVQQTTLARSLARRGYPVSMICMDHGQPDPITIDGITVVKCHAQVGGLPLIRFFHPRLTGLWSALKRVNADIYYQRAAGATTGVVGLFTRWHKRRFVYAAASDLDLVRNETHQLFQRRAGRRDLQLYYLGLKLADVIVAQHEKQQRDSVQWYGRVPTLVRSCYGGPSEPRSASSNGVVLWVSTIRHAKRPERFIELARRLPHLTFRMVGGPSTPDNGGMELFERVKASAALLPNMEFVGFVPYAEIEPHFDAARVFVNTSDYEGFPNTFLQSWARSVPTVSFVETGSVIGGRPVVSFVRDVDEMTTEVDLLMRNDAEWLERGQRARACYERFHSLDSVTSSYERIFETLASGARPGYAVAGAH